MRDKKRIKRVLKQIEKIWVKNPDLRLLQLLLNAVDLDFAAYYLEDDDLERFLGEKYE